MSTSVRQSVRLARLASATRVAQSAVDTARGELGVLQTPPTVPAVEARIHEITTQLQHGKIVSIVERLMMDQSLFSRILDVAQEVVDDCDIEPTALEDVDFTEDQIQDIIYTSNVDSEEQWDPLTSVVGSEHTAPAPVVETSAPTALSADLLVAKEEPSAPPAQLDRRSLFRRASDAVVGACGAAVQMAMTICRQVVGVAKSLSMRIEENPHVSPTLVRGTAAAVVVIALAAVGLRAAPVAAIAHKLARLH